MPIKSSFTPQNSIQITINHLQDVFTFSKQVCQLPYILYLILQFFSFIQGSCSLLLTDIDEIWNDSPYLNNLVKFIQIFWRFSSNCFTDKQITISFAAMFLIPFACLIPLIIGFIRFKYGHSFSQTLGYIICFTFEIFLVFIHYWFPSQLATIIGYLFTDHIGGIIHMIFFAILSLLALILQIIFSYYFVYCESIYSSGRIQYWSAKTRFVSTIYIDGILFSTRMVEVLPKPGAIAFVFVTIIICLLRMLYYMFFFPQVNLISNPFTATITFSFMIAFILESISYFIVHIHIMIILLILLLTIIVSDISFKYIWTKFVFEKYLNFNEILISEECQLFDVVKTPNQFLLLVRFGFVNGHPYVFTWRPFHLALSEWEGHEGILYQFMKFVAIYSQENQLLNDLLTQTKDIRNYQFRNFRKQLKNVRESRNWLFSPKLKRTLKDVDDDVKTVKNYIISYWNAVKDNSYNVSFDIGKHLNEKINLCQLNFLHLISSYPNNAIILTNYAKFLQNVICNPREAQYWLQRKEILVQNKNFSIDIMQNGVFKFFPAIPKVLKNLTVRNDEIQSVQSILSDNPKGFLASQSTEMTEKTTFKLIDSNEEMDLTASSIFDHGKKAPVPFLRVLFILLFLSFFISCVSGFVIPLSITAVNQNKTKNLFISVKTISEISSSFSALTFFFLFESMIVDNILPHYDDMINMLNSTHFTHLYHLPINQTIRQLLLELNEDIHHFQRIYGHEIPTNTLTADKIQDSFIEFISINSTTGENITYSMNVYSALNFLCSYLFRYDEEDESRKILQNDWMMMVHLNTRKIPSQMIDIMNFVSYDMVNTIESTSTNIMKILVVLSIVDVIIIPFFIFFTLRIKHNWKYIMKTINTLPRVAIQKVITRNSKEDKEEYYDQNQNNADEQENFEDKKYKKKQTKRAEFKYQNLFLQMTSSRDTSSGILTTQIIILYTVCMIMTFGSFLLVYFINHLVENQLRSMPIRYYMPNLVSSTNYEASTLFLRRILICLNQDLIGDSLDGSIEDFTSIKDEFNNAINNLIFGRMNNTNFGAITSKSTKLMNLLYDKKDGWVHYGSIFDSLAALPNYVALEILFDIYSILAEEGTKPELLLQPDNELFLTYLQFATFHLPPEFISLISENSSDQFYEAFNITFLMILIIGIVLFCIGALCFFFLLYQLVVVYRTVRFSLSTLSMIDYEYFHDLNNILDLFIGNYTGTDCIKTLNNSMTEMIDVIHEAVIELNEELLVIDANDEMLDWLNLKMYQIKGTRITNHISFSDNKIEKSISQLFNNSKKEEIVEFTSEIHILNKNLVEKRSFEAIYFRNDSQSAVILIFKTTHDLSSMRQQISQLKVQIDDLAKMAIPNQLRHKECFKGQTHIYNAHFVSVTGIEIVNLNEYSRSHKPSETALFYKTFVNKIDQLCESGDKIKFNQSGRFIYIAFNLVKQSPNYYNAANETVDFLYKINDYALENNYKVKYATILLKSVMANLNGLRFSLYSAKIQNVKTLLKYSKEFCVTYSSKFHDLLPRKMTKDAIQVKIASSDYYSNEKQSWAFCLKLVEKSLR